MKAIFFFLGGGGGGGCSFHLFIILNINFILFYINFLKVISVINNQELQKETPSFVNCFLFFLQFK